ncbi:MAG: hypothetical protein DRI81_19820 [Chloroflexi bacterium]|nr:MAG: hypothetical protein DRI81_19820 [Chloroflexota bacterium]
MNIAPLTRFPTAVAIDADSYYYWKVWFRVPIPEHEIDLVTWQPVPRDEWDLNTEGLEALMASPVDLHFYDRYGNHLGPDGSGGFDIEIPASSYEIPEGTDYKVAFVKNADLSDEYDVRLVGTGAGTFDFNLLIPERSAGVKYDVAYVDVPVITGTLGAIDLQPGTGFTLSLDLDGDGQFDQQLAPTAMQTRTLPYIFADDFDRPDSSDLGSNWVEEAGDWDIVDGQLHAQANGEQGVGATESFSDTQYVVETRFRATGNLPGPYNAFALGFGAEDVGGDPTGYSVTYVPAWGKLKLTREYTFLDHASVTLVPGQWYQLKVVRDGDTGLIQVYLDEGQGYPETPTLEAVDSAYPDLRRLGWAVLGSGYDLYVDWIVAQ